MSKRYTVINGIWQGRSGTNNLRRIFEKLIINIRNTKKQSDYCQNEQSRVENLVG